MYRVHIRSGREHSATPGTFCVSRLSSKNDVTSGKKAGGAAKPNERHERSTKEVLFLYQSYKCIEKGKG